MKREIEEALIRIPIVIIGWIIMDLWAVLVTIIGIIHLFVVLFTGKRNKNISVFCNHFVTYLFNFARYATFATNKRPFPWNDFGKAIEKVDMKKNG